jgi:TonB family protein
MKSVRSAGLTLFLLTASAAAAAPQAQSGDAGAQCSDENGRRGTPDQKVAACTALIDGGRLEPAELALTYARRGDGEDWSGHFDKAIADYDKSLALYGDAVTPDRHKRILDARGRSYIGARRDARAVMDFDQALAIDPDYANAYGGRGAAYASLGLFTRALADFDRAVALAPFAVEAYVGRGAADYELGENPRALAELDFAIQAGTRNASAYYYRGLAWLAAGKFESGLQDLDAAIALAPDTPLIQSARARARADQAGWQARLAEPMPPAAAVNGAVPSRAVGRSHDCGALYPVMSRRLGERGDVLVGYDVDEKAAIGNVVVLKSSGSARLDRAGAACVQTYWRNTVALQDGVAVASPGHQAIVRFNVPPPTAASDFLSQAIGRAAVGDYVPAMADLDYAVQLDAKDADSFYWRGLVEMVQGHFDRATSDYDAALVLKPGYSEAADARDLAASERAAPPAAPPPAAPAKPGHSI